MGPVVDVYVDVGRSAAGISLSLARMEQEREIPRDRLMLQTVVEALRAFAGGAYEQDNKPPLFSQIEGLLVFVRTVREWDPPPADGDIRQRAERLGVTLGEYLDGTGEGAGQGEELRKFFWKAHDVAEEVTVTGLSTNPVVEVFRALA